MEKGIPIRAISRGFSVLSAINRHHSLSMMDIARYSNVPYPTACRILQTLLHEGLVEREPSRKSYRPTILVRTLASGYQETDQIVSASRPHLLALGHEVVWPSSISTRVGCAMMVRDSTHTLSPLTLQNYPPGYTLPILGGASGKAYLAFVPEAERKMVLEAISDQGERSDISPATLHLARNGAMFDEIRTLGYAVHGRNKHTATPGKTSSIAVPVFQDGRVVAALAVSFFASALSIQQALDQHLDKILNTADKISKSLSHGAVEAGANEEHDKSFSVMLEKVAVA
jgi:IclR family transcriptional regulator, mhp operon transcriptional activator